MLLNHATLHHLKLALGQIDYKTNASLSCSFARRTAVHIATINCPARNVLDEGDSDQVRTNVLEIKDVRAEEQE